MSETTAPIRVLHVDDDPDLADIVATFLEREHDRIDVRTETNPEDGLAVLFDDEIDCVVSDYDMPRTDGIEFLEAVREEYPDLPFVLYTGKGSEEVASEAISAGVTDYLQKDSGTDQYAILANRIKNAVSARRSAAAAERNRYRLEQILKTVPSCVVRLDRDGRFVFANDRAVEVLGLEESELTDRGYDDPEWEIRDLDGNPIPPEELPFRRVRDSGEPLYGFRHTITWPDGTERILSVNGAPLFDDDGAVESVIFSLTDVTERWEHNRRLEETTARLEALFENSPDMINVHDAEGNIIDPNPCLCEETGYDEEDLTEMKVWDLDVAIDPGQVRSLWDAMEPGDRERIEGVYQRRDGTEFPIEAHIRRLNMEGESRFIAISRDVTERKESERKREQIISRMNDAVIEVDSEWRITLANERAEQFSGLSESELLGTAFWEVFADARGTRFEEIYRQAMDTRDPASMVEYYAGAEEWFDIQVYPNDDGGLAFYFLPVTEHKEHEQELERIRDFFTEAEKLGKLGAWEFDPTGEIIWTEGTRRIHEVEEGFEPTLQDAIGFFHPDDRDRVEEAVETALETGDPYDLEARLITAEGNQRWVRTRGTVLSEEGSPTVRGYIQDITAHKEREQELRNAHTQLENAIEAGAVGTWVWHVPEDRVVVGKEFAERFGVDPDLARNGVELDRFLSSIHEDDRERVTAEIEAAIDACGDYEAEYRVWDAEGELNWVLARGHVECEDETAVTFSGVLMDITERKQIEEELQRQNKRLNEFASLISHDLRNPLNVAEGRLQLAREECDNDHLEAVGRAHERMEDLITDLLALARDGETATDITSVDLAAFAADCWRNVDTAEATLVTDLSLRVRADESRLSQLFENLVRNAVEHGGSDVTVTLGELDDGFYIEDDGPGIPPDERADVFDAGYSTNEAGTGFGLRIVKQVVDAHDWEISVTEGSEGGARFEITGVEFVEE